MFRSLSPVSLCVVGKTRCNGLQLFDESICSSSLNFAGFEELEERGNLHFLPCMERPLHVWTQFEQENDCGATDGTAHRQDWGWRCILTRNSGTKTTVMKVRVRSCRQKCDFQRNKEGGPEVLEVWNSFCELRTDRSILPAHRRTSVLAWSCRHLENTNFLSSRLLSHRTIQWECSQCTKWLGNHLGEPGNLLSDR